MVETLQDDCDSTLHIVTETCGKLQHCESMVSEKAKQCKLCKECKIGGKLSVRWSSEEICGRCQFLLKEDSSGVLQTILNHLYVCSNKQKKRNGERKIRREQLRKWLSC